MPDTVHTTTQVSFAGGLNAQQSPHNLAVDEVQASTNVDYGLEMGAAVPRRGSQRLIFKTPIGTSTSQLRMNMIARDYGLSTGTWDDSSIPWYACSDNGAIWSNDLGANFVPLTTSLGGSQSQVIPASLQYGPYTYIANGTLAIKTSDGMTPFDWLLPQADTPTVTMNPQFSVSPPFIGFSGTATGSGTLVTGTTTYHVGTYTATEGQITGTATETVYGTAVPIILTTCTTGTGTRIVLLGGCTVTNWEDPIVFITTPTGTTVTGSTSYTLGGGIDFHQGWPNGDTTGASGSYVGTATITQTMTIGQYGTDYILLALENQQTVVTIQRDLSIGDASFTNYWHYETSPSAINDATIDPVSALLAAQGQSSIQIQQTALNVTRGSLPHTSDSSGGVSIPPIRRTISKTSISASMSPWATSRSDYQFIGVQSSPDFTNIAAVRIIIEFNTNAQQAVIGGIATYGGVGYSLNDQVAGISYFQTFARVENGVIVAEGAASLPSPPQQTQYAHSQLSYSPTTNTTAGITHRVFYRTGGLLSDAYRVGSVVLGSGSATVYDYAQPDMLIINNPSLRRNLWSTWPSPSAGTGLPGVNAISPQTWQQRAWIGVQNQLYWSYPGVISQIQDNSQTQVADSGDNISAIIPAQNLVIVNQASVYEMSGSIFEGNSQNWTLSRSTARRGSAAPRSCINTPYGIILLGYDGISFYRPGFGVDQELQWIYEKIGDLWKGTATSDPAGIKGRIPALNPLAIFNSCAAYKDERVYLAVPINGDNDAYTVFVLDMAKEKVWMYQYPLISILSLFWDRVANRLCAGTANGTIHQLEIGLTDADAINSPHGIGWSYTTREWSTPIDAIWENLQIENIGTATWLADADNTNTYTLGTTTSTVKDWSPVSLKGMLGDNLNFIFQGTQSGTYQAIYGLEWDAIPLAKKVTFFQTDPIATPSENYVKTWIADLNVFSGTCTGSVLVDGTVVQTATFISPVSAGSDITQRYAFEVGLPNVTYGKNISAVYHATSAFRHHTTAFEQEAKPFGKLTWLVTYKKAGGVTQADMARFFAMDIEGSSTSTITTTWIIDGTAFCTNTLTFGATDGGEEAGRVRNYMDWIPFPPGARGYLFQQQATSTSPFKVWRASLDIDRIGIKGLSRVTQNGSPVEGS